MIEVDQSDYRVDSPFDLSTSGLGPCIGIVVGFQGAVSMLHAPMPNAGGAENFFADLCTLIPAEQRAAIHPILAGGLSTTGRSVPAHLVRTRKWVESEFQKLGFGSPHIHWGNGGPLSCHEVITNIAKGHVEITHHELLGESTTVAVVPLW